MSDYILEAQEVVFAYQDGTEALKGVSLAIEKGKRIAILGANGAGKSTLFLHFNGILRPKRGTIRFNGQNVSYKHSALMELRKNVGIVFQDPDSQLFSASVLQEISFGPLNLGLPKEQVLQRAHQAMEATEIMELQDKPTHALSYGQKKRVSIADILAMEPMVLICDEPTAWLDPKHTIQVLELFTLLSQQGKTVILSTHDVNLAYTWADYVFVMNDGKVVGEGSPEKVFLDEVILRQANLERPWLIEMYQELKKKGWFAKGMPIPRTKDELFKMLNGNSQRPVPLVNS